MTTPNFEVLYRTNECEMLHDAYKAITECNLWDWMEHYVPHKNEGFMFAHHPNLDRLSDSIKYQGHSGSSYGWTMRTMEAIAKSGGWEPFRDAQLKLWPANRPVCFCRKKAGYPIGWCGVAGGGVPSCEH